MRGKGNFFRANLVVIPINPTPVVLFPSALEQRGISIRARVWLALGLG